MGPKDDWQVKRPPLTTAEKRRIQEASKANERDRIKAKNQAHDARMAEEKRAREESRKQHDARAQKLKQMQPLLEKRRLECRLRVLEMLPAIRKRRLAWDDVTISMTTGYANAWERFTKTLDLQRRHEEAMAQVAFSVLSAVSVGGLAMLSSVAQNKWIITDANKLFANGLEDALQVGTEKLMSGLSPSSVVAKQDIPLPLNYYGELKRILGRFEIEMNDFVETAGTRLRTMSIEWFEFFDETDMEQQIEQFWAELDRKFKPVPVDPTAFGKEIEMGLWAHWLGYKMRVGGRSWVIRQFAGAYRGIEGPILNRLHDLKLITEQEKSAIYFEWDKWSHRVFRRLETWGAAWRPSRTFGRP